MSNVREETPKDTPLKQLTLKANENYPPTPPSVHRRVARYLQRINKQEESDSSSDDEYKITLNEDMAQAVDQSNIKIIKENEEKRKIKADDFLYQTRIPILGRKEKTELYFETHGKDRTKGDRIHTSDNTLRRNLKKPLLSPEEMKVILHNEGIQYQDEIKELLLEHRGMFNRWLLWLWQDFNLLTYGLGSKRELLAEFHQHITKYDPTAHVLVVNGYLPSLSIRHIFSGIIDDLLRETKLEAMVPRKDSLDQCQKVFRMLAFQKEYLYLIIHNIDGLALRSDRIQLTLAKLASNKRIRLVASIDHINAPLLWDGNKLCKFNFVWYEAATFLPYTEETRSDKSLWLRSPRNSDFGGENGEELALSSLQRVFESLTPNAKGIYLTIVRYQLKILNNAKKENKKNLTNDQFKSEATYQGISFKDLYRRCRIEFLSDSDISLSTQLTEFRDHKLIREQKGVNDGIDYLVIPLDSAALAKFLTKCNNMNTK